MHTSSSKAPPQTVDDEPLDPLTETAIERLVHLHSGDETEQDWLDYERWKTANTAQSAASQIAETLWEKIGPAVKKPTLAKAALNLLMLVVLIGGLFSVGVQQQIIDSPASLLADHRSATTPLQQITLADGSQLHMDASTQLDIDFSPGNRRIILHGGQLHIDVAPDKNRPFDVIAADVAVRALGTGFNVKRLAQQVSVTVTEHSVKISNTSPLLQQREVVLNQGQHLQYSHTGGFSPATTADLNTLTAWRRGRLIFDNKPLHQVVQEMQRYSRSKIVFIDSSLKQQRVTGVFNSNDTDSMLAAMENSLSLRVRKLPWLVLLEADE